MTEQEKFIKEWVKECHIIKSERLVHENSKPNFKKDWKESCKLLNAEETIVKFKRLHTEINKHHKVSVYELLEMVDENYNN